MSIQLESKVQVLLDIWQVPWWHRWMDHMKRSWLAMNIPICLELHTYITYVYTLRVYSSTYHMYLYEGRQKGEVVHVISWFNDSQSWVSIDSYTYSVMKKGWSGWTLYFRFATSQRSFCSWFDSWCFKKAFSQPQFFISTAIKGHDSRTGKSLRNLDLQCSRTYLTANALIIVAKRLKHAWHRAEPIQR